MKTFLAITLAAVKVAVALICIWFIGHMAVILVDGLSDELEASDLAVVFGNKVHTDGTPSPRLKSRLDRAHELYRARTVPLLLVSGGLGKEGFDEAKVMAGYLAARGVPREHILVDSAGNNSYLTAKHTAHLMKTRGLKSVIAVTQYYHVTRAKLALRRFGVETVRGAHARMAPELRDPYSMAREFAGYYTYLLRSYD